ncbi:MAG: CapA family protein [Myxococcota bacterium]|nr:CapA family protein [Myxococcota bacterium]
MIPLLVLGCARPPAAPMPLESASADAARMMPVPQLVARAEIAAVGDIMMHGSVKLAAERAAVTGPDGQSTNFDGYGALFSEVKGALSSADLTFGNMEFPVAPDSVRATGSMVFNAPEPVLGALSDAGFDVVSFANNHVYDQGVAGFVETIERLESAPLDYLGAGMDCERAKAAKIYEINGIKIGFIAGSRLYNTYNEPRDGQGCSFKITDHKEVVARAAAARAAGAEVVLLSIHWGVEYRNAPHVWDVTLAHRILDGGVDGIIGHHPHVLQPVEVYEAADGRMTFVAYSLGNFISGQGYHYRHGLHHPHVGNTRDGAILRFSVVRKDYGDDVQRVELAELTVDPIWVNRHARGVHPQTQPVVGREAAEGLLPQIAAAEDAAGLQEELGLLLERRAHAASILGAQWLYPMEAAPVVPPGE